MCTGTQASNGMSNSADASSFAMEGPMVALLMPFKPDNLKTDDASFIKYLEVLWSVRMSIWTHVNMYEAEVL